MKWDNTNETIISNFQMPEFPWKSKKNQVYSNQLLHMSFMITVFSLDKWSNLSEKPKNDFTFQMGLSEPPTNKSKLHGS
jgi:uncharacterized phage-like protein YoqJ